MKVVVIGGTGHIGSYLVPRLVSEGHEVVSISRQRQKVYKIDPAWAAVEQLNIDRDQQEKQGQFGLRIAELKADVVIDLICFSESSARQLVDALTDRVQHFLQCGSIWVHGHSVTVPTTEAQARCPHGDYAAGKAAVEALLLARAAAGFPATVLHPGHIVGPGWVPVNPQGHFNPAIFVDLAQGNQVSLPNLGMETLHHVHADDVALAFTQAIKHRSVALGESFHVVSEAALSLRGYAELLADWNGKQAQLEFMPMESWLSTLQKEDALNAYEHIFRSQNCSIEKARTLIDFRPQYGSFAAILQSLQWINQQERL